MTTPIYVGQTNDFPGRVLKRFMTCEKEALKKGKDCIERRVAGLLHLNVVATYQVLEYEPTRLASLVSETNWARKCRCHGYDIANHAEMQNVAGPPITRSQVPKSWLWQFSLDEAIADDVLLEVHCGACSDVLHVPLSSVGLLNNRPRTLAQLRDVWERELCVVCGTAGNRRVRLLVE